MATERKRPVRKASEVKKPPRRPKEPDREALLRVGAGAGSIGSPRIVTVFGGGVAGLTVAHELVERGFLVQLVESEESLTQEGCCEVGGVAATQWSFLPDSTLPYGAAWKANWYPPSGAAPPAFEQLVPAPALPYRIYFEVVKRGQNWVRKGYDDKFAIGPVLGVPNTPERTENLPNSKRMEILAREIRHFCRSLPAGEVPHIYVVGHSERTESEAIAREWSEMSAIEVSKRLPPLLPGIKLKLTPIGVGSAEPVGDNRFSSGRVRNNRVELHVAGVRVPGDHGYRFFPAFYRNLDDTMRRTPLYDEHQDETGETALSRLKGTPDVSIALADGSDPFRLPRRRARTFEELRDITSRMFDKFGYTTKDLALFQLQLFRFLTMCPERRSELLDDLSWIRYIRGLENAPGNHGNCPRCKRPRSHDHALPFSKRFLDDLDKLPQAMAGMRGSESDAHTNGIISLQLMLDQLGDGTHVDRLLDGPTSTSWLAHWKSYLRRQGVRFFLGRLVALDAVYSGSKLVGLTPVALGLRRNDYFVIHIPLPWGMAPIYIVLPPLIDPVPEPVFADEVATREALQPSLIYEYEKKAEYYVAAIPVAQLRDMLNSAVPTYPDLEEPLKAIRDFNVGTAFAGRSGPPADHIPFRDVTGIQFYFANHFHLADGHVYHSDSAWRLTSVSQLQFWRQRRNSNSGYLGIISVDIGEMHEGDTSRCTKAALELADAIEQLAKKVRASTSSALEAMLESSLSTRRHVRVLDRALRRWVARLSKNPGSLPPAWGVVENLEAEIDAKATLLLDGWRPRTTGLWAVLYELLAGRMPSATQISNLQSTIQEVGRTPPLSLSLGGGDVWNAWKASLESLNGVLDSLSATHIAIQATWASRILMQAFACLDSLHDIPFAWQSTSEEIARSTWRQIEVALHEHLRASMPSPNFYHLDRGITFSRLSGGKLLPERNANPFFINAVKGFDLRPGVLPGTARTPFYQIAYKWLPVGGVMKSHTRITSMEHANESGRHAARAILHDLVTRAGQMFGTMPKYWSPENHELEELSFLRRVDEVLNEEGHPHLVDILGLEEAVIRWVQGDGAESTDELGNLLSAIRHQSDRDFAPWIEAMEKTSEPVRRLIEFVAQAGMRSSLK